jgi:hypothetical protein
VSKIKNKILLVFALGAFFTVFQAGPASAECQAFPKLAFWGDMSHDSVKNYVETKYDGDWASYIGKLEKIKKGLTNIQQRGKGAVIKLQDRKVTLRGGKLGDYIQKSIVRIDTVRCLADEAEMDNLQNFATAAGGNDAKDDYSAFPAPVSRRDELRTYVTLPMSLVVELRKQATRRSLIENRKVSVNDVITRSLRKRYSN